MTLSFIPATADQAASWAQAGGSEGAVAAHRVTGPYLEAFEIDGTTRDGQETAEYGCLCVASVSCLTMGHDRLVLVADSAASWVPETGDDAEFGVGTLASLAWSDVTSFYMDDPAATADVRAAISAVTGMTVSQAWEDPTVASVVQRHDLLWHDVAEWRGAESH